MSKPRPSVRSPDEGDPALRLATFLPYRLNVLAAIVSQSLSRQYNERHGLAVPEWRVIATVGEFGAITAKAIGAHAHMGKVMVSRAAGALEGRGLIRRVPNPQDKREAFLTLTRAGQATYRAVAPLALDYAARLTEALPEVDLATLDRLIDTLQTRARAL